VVEERQPSFLFDRMLMNGTAEYRKMIELYFYARGLTKPKYMPDLDDALDAVESTALVQWP
jgi:hypothetical protein